jgi:Cu2+-containing amine oxidase
MQLKNPRDFALEHWNKVGADIDIDDAVELLTQDRQDTINAVIELIKDELRNAPLEVQMTKGVIFANIITKLQALSPK